jgi:hypothetical protein
MAKKIIELHNGRIKRTGNRIGGDTNSLETRHRRRDNEAKRNLRSTSQFTTSTLARRSKSAT